MKQKKILIVEDYPANILILSTLLEQLGYECEVAQTGEEAIEKFEAAENAYQLLFMDLNLPKMDGFVACEEIRRIENRSARQATPIIGLTADVNEQARQRSRHVGMNGLIVKTMSMDDLANAIDTYALA